MVLRKGTPCSVKGRGSGICLALSVPTVENCRIVFGTEWFDWNYEM